MHGTHLLLVVLSLEHMTDTVCTHGFTLQNLTGIKGLSEAKVDKICEAAEKLLVCFSYSFFIDSGSELLCHQFSVIQSSEVCVQFGFQNQGFMTGSDLLIKVRK